MTSIIKPGAALLMLSCMTLAASAGEGNSVALFLNGTLGDKSFFDGAAAGIGRATDELGLEARVIEAGFDPTRWQNVLTDLADSGEFNTIVALSYDMATPVQIVAQQFPDVKFILLDSSVDYENCECANVYSALFRQNEGAYLAGVLAAEMIKQGVGGLPPGALLGTVGGMDVPTINDFIIGFEAGAKSVVPAMETLKQYANSFADPATGKEIAKAQYSRGAGVIFPIAGGTGQGVIEAAAEAGKFVIGVDVDQALIYRNHPEVAQHIVTSVVKNIDVVVFRSLELEQQGGLPFGSAETLGLKEGGLDLADNEITRAVVPANILEAVATVKQSIVNGEIVVPSAF